MKKFGKIAACALSAVSLAGVFGACAKKKGAAEKRIYMAFSALSCFLGCMSPFLGVLNVCDAFNGLMALLNVPALFVLTPQVFAKQIAQKPKKV